MTEDNTEDLMSYNQLLEEIKGGEKDEKGRPKCHLLLGNEFNLSFGIDTNCKDIFEQMQIIDPLYKQNYIHSEISKTNYDVEEFLKKLQKQIEDIDDHEKKDYKRFLKAGIKKKVKLDFINACSIIMEEEVKKIYEERNENINLLFEYFSEYFTLDFAPYFTLNSASYIYPLILKNNNPNNDEKQCIMFASSKQKIKDHMREKYPEVYEFISNLRNKNGKKTTTWKNEKKDKESITKDLSEVSKESFKFAAIDSCRQHFSTTTKPEIKKVVDSKTEIRKVVDFVWKEKHSIQISTNVDALHFNGLKNGESEEKKLFFLRGAFSIDKKNGEIHKITQTSPNILLNDLQQKIGMEDGDSICILAGDSDENFSDLSGSIVILGSKLGDNDAHIFDKIKKSKIKKVYIGSSNKKEEHKEKKDQAEKFFSDKEIKFFDYETISFGSSDTPTPTQESN